MNQLKTISSNKSLVLPEGKNTVCSLAITAGDGAAATVEIFSGKIGVVATAQVAVGGTLYAVGDEITLEDGYGETSATFLVETVDAPETGVVTALTLVDGGDGYDAGIYATTSNSVDGTNLTIEVLTVTDADACGKVAAVAGTSEQLKFNADIDGGISARITGTDAKAYLLHK